MAGTSFLFSLNCHPFVFVLTIIGADWLTLGNFTKQVDRNCRCWLVEISHDARAVATPNLKLVATRIC